MDDINSARQKLTDHGGYGWLLDGADFWSVKMLVIALAKAGMPINTVTVTRWVRELPHTQDFSGNIGMRASKNDLIIFFASTMK